MPKARGIGNFALQAINFVQRRLTGLLSGV